MAPETLREPSPAVASLPCCSRLPLSKPSLQPPAARQRGLLLPARSSVTCRPLALPCSSLRKKTSDGLRWSLHCESVPPRSHSLCFPVPTEQPQVLHREGGLGGLCPVREIFTESRPGTGRRPKGRTALRMETTPAPKAGGPSSR